MSLPLIAAGGYFVAFVQHEFGKGVAAKRLMLPRQPG
jgi:hypothetical protein